MASKIDEITINFEENGVQVVKELDKAILTKGAWSTIMFKYQDLDRKTEMFGPVKYVIRRYRKMNDEYRSQSKFNISGRDQAQKVIDVLQGWLAESDE